MQRVLLLPILVSLRFSTIWTQCMHSILLNICNCFENLFRLCTAVLNQISESFIIENNTAVKKFDYGSNVSTQTSPNKNLSGFRHRKNDSIDIFIYNLKSEQKIKIKHKALKKKSTNNCSHCERCKSFEKLDNTYSKIDNLSLKTGDTSSITKSNLSQSKDLNYSNMSIEKEISNSKILISKIGSTYLNTLNENLADKSTQYFSCDFQNDENILPHFEESEERECGDENISLRETSLEERMGEGVQHQTSSPIENWAKFPATEQRTHFNTPFHNNQDALETEKITPFPENVAKTPTSAHFNRRDSILENTVLLDENVKQRLSSSLNIKSSAAKEAALSLKTIQDELLENARKTPRYEMSLKEIKFPYQSGVNGLLQTMDEKEEAKEVFSCSSYESLPVSDHIRTAFEKSILSSLYTDNFTNITEPDFSSVDSLVEAFRKFERAIAFGDFGKNQIGGRFVSNVKSKNLFERELSVESGTIDQRPNQPCIRKALSSGMLNTNCLLSHKDNFVQDFSELRYQNRNQCFTPVKSTSLKSVISCLPSISDAEIPFKESEFNNKCEKRDCFENKLHSSDVESIDKKCLKCLHNCGENKNRIAETEGNQGHSGFNQIEKIEDFPEDNKENQTVSEKSIQNSFKSQPKLEQIESENNASIEQEDVNKIKLSETLKNSKGEVNEPSRTIYSLTSIFEKSEIENNWSTLVNIDSSDEMKNSSKESLNENENLTSEEYSKKSMDSGDIKKIQSIMNNIDKYKITYIDDANSF